MRPGTGIAAGLALLVAGCGDSAAEPLPAALTLLVAGPAPAATDTFEVWVCRVPDTTTDPWYLPGGARLDLAPGDLADRLDASVPRYFADLSHGGYRPAFIAGGEITITSDEGHQDCIDRALAVSGDDADAVFVVADAEHGGDQPGGLAQPGSGCDCPARTSRRMVYLGASDFHPDWGTTPAVDLAEHEIGHTLGWPHSGDADSLAAPNGHAYSSALDVMSDSAAPRATDAERRHAPATIAANLLAAGWLPAADAAIVPAAGGDVELRPSSDPDGTRVAIVALDEQRLLTVELLTPTGDDDHLPEPGIAVHLVDQSPRACGHADGTACTGLLRRQVVLGSAPPHTDLLSADESLDAEGWRITVESLAADGGSARVTIAPR